MRIKKKLESLMNKMLELEMRRLLTLMASACLAKMFVASLLIILISIVNQSDVQFTLSSLPDSTIVHGI